MTAATRNPIYLGVNIDHVATLRQARGTVYPEPLKAALIAEQAGADLITLHLREDRRHIGDRDVLLLREMIQTRMNLEMAVTDEMLSIAEKVKPHDVCLVPEKREELTTEGGLEVAGQKERMIEACDRLAAVGTKVSLFIDPDKTQIAAAKEVGAPAIEVHTGAFAEATDSATQQREYQRICEAVSYGEEIGLYVNAGHGLHYHNTAQIAAINGIRELNIGHAIIAHAVFVGLENAVKEMKALITHARHHGA